jgi:hypothetical protein
VAGSDKKYWWQCPLGHEWQAIVKSVCLRGTRCPVEPCATSRHKTALLAPGEQKKRHAARKRTVDSAGEVDLADPVHKIAVEVNGCYYHGCLGCGFSEPGNRGQRERDAAKAAQLERLGWHLVVIWGHELPASWRRKLRRGPT